MRDLGHLYQDGIGVTADLPRAVALYEQAVGRGDPKAMEYLGRMLDQGQGVPATEANKIRAVQLFQRAYAVSGASSARDWLMSHDQPLDATTQPGRGRGRGTPPATGPANTPPAARGRRGAA